MSATFADALAAVFDAAEVGRLREDYAMDRGASVRGWLASTLIDAATDHDWRPLPDSADERARRVATAERNLRLHRVRLILSACDPAISAGHAVTLVDLCNADTATPYADPVGRRAAYNALSDAASKAARAQLDALRFLATHYPDELWP